MRANALSATLRVNPPEMEPQLSKEQVWRGLVMKAENARLFVPGMESCNVLKTWDGGLLREAVFQGEKIYEKITFTEPVEVYFERIDGSGSWITNTISESDDGLLLTFTFVTSYPDERDISQVAKDTEEIRTTYIAALSNTLKTIRELVRDGTL